MDRASQVLAQGVLVAVSKSYRALVDYSGVARSTLYYRARGRRSIKEKAQSQQYLSPSEDEAVVTVLCKTGVPVSTLFGTLSAQSTHRFVLAPNPASSH